VAAPFREDALFSEEQCDIGTRGGADSEAGIAFHSPLFIARRFVTFLHVRNNANNSGDFMKKFMPLLIGGGILLVLLMWYIGAQNNLVTLEENVNGKWSQVENVYQRRLDLIPNLVETVKGYAAQEKDVLTEVTELRSRVGQMTMTKEMLNDPQALQRYQDAQAQLGGALSRLLVVSENYPDLKSNQNFLALQSQLEGTENRIAVERKRFIESVQEYNTAIRRFPTSLVASIGGFEKKATFSADEGADKAPKVKF